MDENKTVNFMDIETAHTILVRSITKNGEDIIRSLTPEKADLWHMGTGVSGEAGELLDAIKKFVVYGKDLDRTNVIEELGDLEFYMRRIREIVNVTREEVLKANYDKLSVRYGPNHKYSDQAAIDRADKDETA